MTERIGRYEVLRRVAAGGMAEVLLARQVGPHGFQRVVAVKRVLPEHAADAEFVASFLDEARISARLQHPNVVQVLDFGEDAGSLFLAMEYVAGENCLSLMRTARDRGERIPPEIAALIAIGACDGLQHAHTLQTLDGKPLRLVHRDISPSNVMVGYDGVVKVLDFGVARSEDRATRTGTGELKGKMPYVSPEQVRGERLDARHDLWSLGVMLHELCTGQRLFARPSGAETLQAVAQAPIPSPSEANPDIPRALSEAILRALARDRDARFESAKEMREALEPCVGPEALRDPRETLGRYLARLYDPERIAQKVRPAPPAEEATVKARVRGLARIERRVGRLLEVRQVAPLTFEDFERFHRQVSSVISACPSEAVVVADLRRIGVLPPELADVLSEMMRSRNSRIERDAILVRQGELLGLQLGRVVANSGHSERRIFRDAAALIHWLDERLDEAERARLRAFLEEVETDR